MNWRWNQQSICDRRKHAYASSTWQSLQWQMELMLTWVKLHEMRKFSTNLLSSGSFINFQSGKLRSERENLLLVTKCGGKRSSHFQNVATLIFVEQYFLNGVWCTAALYNGLSGSNLSRYYIPVFLRNLLWRAGQMLSVHFFSFRSKRHPFELLVSWESYLLPWKVMENALFLVFTILKVIWAVYINGKLNWCHKRHCSFMLTMLEFSVLKH